MFFSVGANRSETSLTLLRPGRVSLLVLLCLMILGPSQGAGRELHPALEAALRSPELSVARGSGLAGRDYEGHISTADGAVRIRRADAPEVQLVPVRNPLDPGGGFHRSGSVLVPAADRDAAVSLSLLPNGLKEDIVLTRSRGDALTFEWELRLGDGLRAERDGLGNVEVLHAGRPAYRIPAPVVIQADGTQVPGAARFELRGERLLLHTRGLDGLQYPINIDPSLEITDFVPGGNDEGGVGFENGRVVRSRSARGVGAWSSTGALPEPRSGHCSVGYGGRLYVLGGQNSGPMREVYVAPISTSGAVGPFVATTPLPSGRESLGCAAYDGFLYAVGGRTSAAVSAEVLVATVQSDGSVGAWQSVAPLPSARHAQGVVAHRGHLYVVGGSDGALRSEVFVSQLRADGTLESWRSLPLLPRVLEGAVVSAYQGRLYVAGGSDGTSCRTEVLIAETGADGSIIGWRASTSPLLADASTGGCRSAGVAYRGHLYVAGGSSAPSGPSLPGVQVAPILENGDLGAFATSTALARGRRSHSVVGHGDHLVAIGGADDGTVLADVGVAPLDADGELGPWQPLSSLPTPRALGWSIVVGGRIYVTGGTAGASGPSFPAIDEVRSAQILPDGSLGVWTSQRSLPGPRLRHATATFNSVIYVAGGCPADPCITPSDNVFAASVNDDGSLGPWSMTRFPSARYNLSLEAYNGRLYAIGGGQEVLFAPINADGTLGAWVMTTLLPGPLHEPATTIYGGRLYVAGGYDATSVDTVLSAPIRADGTLGSWTQVGTLPSARDTAIAAYDGKLYVLGGATSSALTDDVLVADILADGTLGPWRDLTRLPRAVDGQMVVAYNGALYVAGGYASGNQIQDTVFIARVPGHAGTGDWTSLSPFATPRSGLASVTNGRFAWVIGGLGTGVVYDDVQVAPINPDGTLGAWRLTTPLPSPRHEHSAVVVGDRIYVTGGQTSGSVELDEVLSATIQPDGSLGPWVNEERFSGPRRAHASVGTGGYLYVIGGDAASTLADVQRAPILSNGSLGPWSATTSLPFGRYLLKAVVHGGFIYVVGGVEPAPALSQQVLVAPVLSGGSLGPWQPAGSGSMSHWAHDVVTANGHIYVLGGEPVLTEAKVAPILGDGTLGNWNAISFVPSGLKSHASFINAGRLYVLGGLNLAAQSAVWMTPLITTAPRGIYSRRFDLGPGVGTVDSITLGGTPGRQGSVQLRYQIAPESGVYGPLAEKGKVPLDVPVPLGDANPRYLRVELTLDDAEAIAAPADWGKERDIGSMSVAWTDQDATDGGVDAGVDPGDVDGGVVGGEDGGLGGAPRPGPLHATVGCDCGAGGAGPGIGLLALLLLRCRPSPRASSAARPRFPRTRPSRPRVRTSNAGGSSRSTSDARPEP